MTTNKPVNPYLNKWLPKAKVSTVPSPEKVIIPTWVLVSFFEDYDVNELLIQPDKENDGIKIVMMSDGKRLPSKKIKLNTDVI